MGMMGKGVDQKVFVVEKGEMKLVTTVYGTFESELFQLPLHTHSTQTTTSAPRSIISRAAIAHWQRPSIVKINRSNFLMVYPHCVAFM
jgi:hypothetical protein